MSSKFVDTTAIMQVIGCIYKHPYLLEQEDKYFFHEEDFTERFHQTLFGSIYNLKMLGANKIDIDDILNYLSTRPTREAEFKVNKGEEYLAKLVDIADLSKFDYYYGRMKKMTLLRFYDNNGIDVRDLYDPDNILDIKKKQIQEDWLDNSSLEMIAQKIDDKIEMIKSTCVDNSFGKARHASEGIRGLIDRLKETPEVGVPLYGPLINTVTRGARLKKFYLRSAPTGCGKSRSMIADACNISCNEIYDEQLGWIKNGNSEPTLYITTEQELEEVQTMMLAFLSNVNEDKILNGNYENDEEERVIRAAEILERSPLYVEELPDFSLRDIESTIKRNVRDNQVKYVFHDYIHTSLKILEEITKRSGGVKLREDNILFMISIRLKDLCNELGIFIMSATQLNGDWQEAKEANQNLLRGAKAIADKIDLGAIILPTKEDDIVSLEKILSTGVFQKPNLKLSIYKNRRGKFKSVILWCHADLGTCRIKPMFLTDHSYEMLPIENINIVVEEE
ncbi:MAG: hypothetical protein MSA56_12585, partial [Clostridium sp.]|nr:hypothetical protein [Clostridium sp.]